MDDLEEMVKKETPKIEVLSFDDISKLIGFKGQHVFYRAGFDCLDEDKGGIKDPARIDALLPSLKQLSSEGAMVVIYSHNGRPEGVDKKLSMDAIADYLKSKGLKVKKLDACFGEDVKKSVEAMKPGDIILTENMRFWDKKFSAEDLLIKEGLFKIYVNAAWPVSHRKSPDMVDVVGHIDYACADPQVFEEYRKAVEIVGNPKKPYVVIIGGKKSDKTELVPEIIKKADYIIPVGAFLNSIAKVRGINIQKSLHDPSEQTKKMIEDVYESHRSKLIYPPIDVIVADDVKKPKKWQVCKFREVPEGYSIVGIGPESIGMYSQIIKNARTVAWAGPFDVYENKNFRAGTEQIGHLLASRQTLADVLICGGDTGDAAHEIGFAAELEKVKNRYVHISTGGGVNLPLLAGKSLPAIDALNKNYKKHEKELKN